MRQLSRSGSATVRLLGLILSLFIVSGIADAILLPRRLHHHGGNDTDCFLQDGSLCLTPPVVISFSLLRSQGSLLTLSSAPSPNLTVFDDQAFVMASSLTLLNNFTMTSSPRVLHWNVHSCRVDIGWCTPDVQKTPGLVTQTLPLTGNSEAGVFSTTLTDVSAGLWNIIVHYEFVGQFPQSGATADTFYSVSAGFLVNVLPRSQQLMVSSIVVTLFTVASWFGILLALCAGVGVCLARDHWVLRAASPALLCVVAVGLTVSFASVLVFLPASSPMMCRSRPFLLCIGYDLVVFPLGLKTWRVARIFDSSSFQRRIITDRWLLQCAGVAVLTDVVLLSVWTVVAPLTLSAVPSVANPSVVFTTNCLCNNQRAWEAVTIALHLTPLAGVAVVARRVRLHFARRTTSMLGVGDDLRMAYFNESESISLCLVSLFFISVFALAMQFTIFDSPTAQTLMVCGGIAWSATFSLVVMFAPKLAAFAMFEKDGITRRPSTFKSLSSGMASNSSAPIFALVQAPKPFTPSGDLALL